MKDPDAAPWLINKGRAAPDATTGTQALVGCLGVALIVGLLIWWLIPGFSDKPRPLEDTRPGSYFRTIQPSYCSPSEEDARLAARAIMANDKAAITGMMRRGRFLVLAEATRVRWRWPRPPALVKVLIESGEHAGIECYALDGHLRAE